MTRLPSAARSRRSPRSFRLLGAVVALTLAVTGAAAAPATAAPAVDGEPATGSATAAPAGLVPDATAEQGADLETGDPAAVGRAAGVEPAAAAVAPADAAAAAISLSGSIRFRNANGTFTEPTTGAISVTVLDANGDEVAVDSGTARFSFPDLTAEAPYYLRVDDAFGEWTRTFYGDTPFGASATPITASTSTAVITMTRPGSINGFVQLDASAGGWTSFSAEAWGRDPLTDRLWKLGTTSLGSDGGPYTIAALPAADYVVRVRPQYTPPYDRGFADRYFPDASTVYDASLVTLSAGGMRVGIDFTLPLWQFYRDRISGADRYQTAVAATRSAFDPGIPVLYVASGENWPDALSAGPAASAEGGALLLSPRDSLPASVITEIRRLAPERIVAVGGTSALSAAVVARLTALQPKTSRVGGADRYETSRLVVEGAFEAFRPGSGHDVYLATGRNYPDALSIGPVAGRYGEPVILVDPDRASDPATTTLVASLTADRAVAVGGEAVVPSAVASALVGAGAVPSWTRVAGNDRYETSRQIALEFPQSQLSYYAYFASGLGFADALAGSTVAAAYGAPVYLVPPTCVPWETVLQMREQRVFLGILLGGPATLSDDVADFRTC